MSETLREGLALTAMGMLIVFTVLATMALVVTAMRRFDDRWQQKEIRDAEAAVHRPPTLDDTTVVLIAAAVATLLGGRGRIRRIRRMLPSDAPFSAWSMQGRVTLLGSHVVTRKPNGGRS